MHPTAHDIARLSHKYRTLAELRRERARGAPVPPRDVFRDLAKEFPGALNELDMLPLEELERRARDLDGALAGAPVEPWMAWLHGYHALFRAALRLKLRLSRAREVTAERALILAADASEHAGVEVSVAFVEAVASPPDGRLAGVVFDALAEAFGAPVDDMKDALFPRRRGRRVSGSGVT